MTMVICFAGQIGSGKSSVSTAVTTALGWHRTGFGDYLRSRIVRAGGDPTSREALQDLGQRLVDADPVEFCRLVLTFGGYRPGEDFLIDGVRHVQIFQILKQLCAPSDTRLLFLDASDADRLARVQDRADGNDFVRAGAHGVESQLRSALPAIADRVVDAMRPFDDVVADCIASIRAWQQA